MPVTTPAALTVAIDDAALLQVPDAVDESVTVLPTQTVDGPEMESGTVPVTVTTTEALQPVGR